MFRDLSALFITDGVPVDLVRAGAPRLRERHDWDTDEVATPAPARERRPVLRWLARPLST